MGRVWLEAATLAHIERAVLLIKTRNDLEKKDPVPDPHTASGVFHESFAHSRYKRLKSNRGLRASRSRRCPIMAPATMAGPTKGKEGCLGTVGEAWARRLDGCVVGRRQPHRRR